MPVAKMVVVIVDLVDVGVGVLEVVDVNRGVVEWVAGWRSRRRERERERAWLFKESLYCEDLPPPRRTDIERC